ncbi:hydroxymethylglutaryl-CoA reductase (NADPH) [Sulfolobus acidocaldarius]|uniref:3-hydroxy-3-methylglutaryl coenzyme A reductase n=4 Tax=Sulfolobus acidocaldarius TaxID=2285 RepID=Q4J936_SULAC|nr:hydroxymethylglutaryl-CoA reductase (NADPH) [Sulfolobus acidocaldarius]AAY80694.1 3-hydroxy-3-methylglutaryl-coenzyme A reductase [Sulfolobus acidocaldarius DSM 639]AGE71291.1 3-hydroxy-3-methylglutaryl coenzyme A reductase [Sulfolobus acidocaldarius N8]AGE73560.1 3-hydroxy-3-methylglutaryl coenzyme A reductase [Sulfolobus acidocaldarius Ron12/I]ALU30449.1 3-hydroxy-3-methylglutaryl-CoA reductase [Sulfolobus acidocaldarius]ALU31171.1 3-hydroxy-3-methylglutaryl-CoA reductase [Sulfolobus acid
MQETIDNIVDKVVKGQIQFHEIDNLLEANAAMVARRLAIEKLTGAKLPSIGSTIIDYAEIRNKNAENVIGAVQVPLGIIGPLKIDGEYAKGDFYVPLATTEGALIASVNRGAKAVTLSGGTRVKIFYDGMTRAPIFKLDSIRDVAEFLEWVDKNKEKLEQVANSTTSHGKLSKIEPLILGNNVWLRFVFSTGDAMGMNMATIASEKLCEFIEKEFGKATCLAVSGNVCSDKKQSMINALHGRGKTVVAEALIPDSIVKSALKSDKHLIHEVNLRKNWLGGARAGNIFQYNAHFANIIAAIFLATGQDIAQVVESSMGYTWTEVRENGLYISITLNSLEVGTVGGGTRLPTQREALSIMGVLGSGNPPGSNARKFAEIVASAVLAGELNLLSALANKELGKAHAKLGRGMKV